MEGWYEKGYDALMNEIVAITGASLSDVHSVYTFLSEIGMIDYDIEKEVIYDRYIEE